MSGQTRAVRPICRCEAVRVGKHTLIPKHVPECPFHKPEPPTVEELNADLAVRIERAKASGLWTLSRTDLVDSLTFALQLRDKAVAERDEARAALQAKQVEYEAMRDDVTAAEAQLAALREERTRYFVALDTIASWHENDLRFTLSDALRIAKKACTP